MIPPGHYTPDYTLEVYDVALLTDRSGNAFIVSDRDRRGGGRMTDCFKCANFDEGEGKCRFYVLSCSFDMNADCEEYEPLNADAEVDDE